MSFQPSKTPMRTNTKEKAEEAEHSSSAMKTKKLRESKDSKSTWKKDKIKKKNKKTSKDKLEETALKIREITKSLMRIRNERKRLFPPKYTEIKKKTTKKIVPTNFTFTDVTEKSPTKKISNKKKERVDMDAMYVQAAHSPYLVRPEDKYSDDVVFTNEELREMVIQNNYKKLRDISENPFDVQAAKEVYLKEVAGFKREYKVRFPLLNVILLSSSIIP